MSRKKKQHCVGHVALVLPVPEVEIGHTVDHCEVCGRQAELVATPSQLCNQRIMKCGTCGEQHAETHLTVGWYLRSSTWKKLDKYVKRQIRFWYNENYVTYHTYFRGLLRQQMIIKERVEPVKIDWQDEDFDNLIDLLITINPPLINVLPERKRQKSLIELIQTRAWLRYVEAA